jgi:molybdate transport system substrate-binding protein
MTDRLRRARLVVGCLTVVGLLAAACGSDDAADRSSATGVGGVSGEVVVFAAASLTEAFTELADEFMRNNPDASVTLNFAASSELVAQIVEGAPADVYASADPANMAKLTDAEAAATEPVEFATNRSEIVVEPGNPLAITGVQDLADGTMIVVTCAPQVPCGEYAAQIFDNAGVTVTPDSYEENVKAVVTKVALGEADAGIAYATDVIAAGDAVGGVEIAAQLNVVARYPIALTTESTNPDGGRAFIDLVLGDVGQTILRRYGFTSP